MIPTRRPFGSWPAGLFAPAAGPSSAADAPATPNPPAGAGVPFVERVPDAEDRLRRFTEKVAMIVNSLLRNGSIRQTSPGVFVIDGSAIEGDAAGLTGTFDSPGVYG